MRAWTLTRLHGAFAHDVVSGASVVVACAAWVFVAGCGGDARLELAAADVLRAVASEMEGTAAEYHEEVSRYDDSRETEVASAFVARVQADGGDTAALESHVADFGAALRKIREDRETEWSRRTAAMENVGVLREVAKGLEKLAIESLTLEDETRRYLSGWIEARRRAGENAGQVGK